MVAWARHIAYGRNLFQVIVSRFTSVVPCSPEEDWTGSRGPFDSPSVATCADGTDAMMGWSSEVDLAKEESESSLDMLDFWHV